MKIKCLFLTALLLASLSLTTFSQTPLIQTDDERAGSADTLNGKVYVVSIFISTPDNPWKKQDKLSTFEKHKEAQNQLVEQAAEYDVELEFENGTYGLNGDDISVENIPVSDKTGKGMTSVWSSYLLKKIGYKTPLGLLDWVEEKTDCTNLHVIVFSNSKGVSYASYYKPGTDKEKYFVELALVHRYYPTGSELYSSTISSHSQLDLTIL